MELIIELQQIRSEWRMQLKHELQQKKSYVILYHVEISRGYFFICRLKIVFYFLHELKRRTVTSLDGIFVRRCFKSFTRRFVRSKAFQKTSDIQDGYPNLARKTGTLSLTSKNYVLLELQIHTRSTRSQQQHVVSLNMNHERALNIKSQINCS